MPAKQNHTDWKANSGGQFAGITQFQRGQFTGITNQKTNPTPWGSVCPEWGVNLKRTGGSVWNGILIEAFPTSWPLQRNLKMLLFHDNACEESMQCIRYLKAMDQVKTARDVKFQYWMFHFAAVDDRVSWKRGIEQCPFSCVVLSA